MPKVVARLRNCARDGGGSWLSNRDFNSVKISTFCLSSLATLASTSLVDHVFGCAERGLALDQDRELG